MTDKNAIKIEFDVKVPVRDGITLATDIYRPPEGGPFPAVLMRSPYSNKNPALIYLARNIASRGFTMLVQNIRGRFASEGTFFPFENEREDGHDTLVWLATQEWFDGKLNLLGWSYSSYLNYLIMGLEPVAGVKIVSAVCGLEVVQPYVATFPGGALNYIWALPWTFGSKGKNQEWLKKSYIVDGAVLEWPEIFRMLPLNAIPNKMNIPVPVWDTWISHPTMDDYWKGINLDKELREIETPVLHMTGWYDYCVKQTIDAYQVLNQRLDNQALLIGPWDHENIFSAMMRNLLPQQKKPKERAYGADGDFDLFEAIMHWFVSWTNNENPLNSSNRVRFFVKGGDFWRQEPDWPVAGFTATYFYLDENGALTTQKPEGEGEDRFTYDPSDPVPTTGGAISAQGKALRAGPLDQRPIENRSDVLVYTSAPLTHDLEVSGPLKAVLFASTNAIETDFTVKLVDVYPDETAEILQDGIIRTGCRPNANGERLLEQGKIYQFDIDVAATSNLFKAGHAVRVEVSSSNFPKYDRNLNTGTQIGTSTEFKVAEQTIYRGGDHASYICLPTLAKFVFVLFVFCAFGWIPARANDPTQIANYNIRAQLDVNTKVVTGSEEISWTNTTDDQVSELQFHLYMNAFKDDKSTYIKERGGISATFKGWGSIEVKKITLSDGTDLTNVQEFIHPDDDNAADQTVMRVPLPKPVAPGETLRLNIEFVTKLPRILARSGFRGDYFFVGQWYPKLGVYEKPKGAEKGAWNCHQYHLTSEFYADFGSYNVQLTVPSNYVVGATGELVATQADAANKTTTYTYAQNEVHDFAWSTSPRFQRVERTFDPSSEVTQGELEAAARLLQVPPSELSLTPVKVTLLLQPEHLNQAERHWDTIKKLIKFFGLRFGRYPYKTFTLVDTPANAGGGGMEYPTLVTTDTRWLWSENTKDLEGLIAHEFAHQYWYGLVANNEFEHAMLDEGFANYSTVLFTETAYGKDYNGLPLYLAGAPIGWLFRPFAVSETEFNRAIYLMDPKGDAGGKPAWRYADDFSYSLNNAFKFSLILKTLENHLGEQTMARVMRTYFERWRFRHPKPQDFFDVVHEVSGRDLKDFYAQAVYGSNVLDYAIEGISSNSGDHNEIESEVVVRRLGELVFPVTIKVTFADGQTSYSEWDGKDRSTKIKFARPAAVQWAQVDPENKILLDVNLANNSKSVESNHLVAAGISAKLLFWLQTALQSLVAIA